MLKRTPLFAAHQKLGARLVEFGGWEMPVQYTSIVDEHHAVRKAAGIFDICHMGEVRITGTEAAAFLNHLLTNDIRKLTPGFGQYTLMCNERGGVVDDLYAYCLGQNEFLLIINASRIEPDTAWMRAQLAAFPGRANVTLVDESERSGAVAIQGPTTVQFIESCVPGKGLLHGKSASALIKNEVDIFPFGNSTVLVARTGYTGEDGFEVVADAGLIETIWNLCLEKGAPHGLKPTGLGARDTLRTEACYPLYGHELDEQTTPIEAGVGFFVGLDKPAFNGRETLAAQKAAGPTKRCIAFRMTDKSAPPRPQYAIYANGAAVGQVVSGTQSPTLNAGIGLGYVPANLAKPGTAIEIEIRGKRYPAEVIQKPFYKRPAA